MNYWYSIKWMDLKNMLSGKSQTQKSTVDPWTMQGLGADPPAQLKFEYNFLDTPQT